MKKENNFWTKAKYSFTFYLFGYTPGKGYEIIAAFKRKES